MVFPLPIRFLRFANNRLTYPALTLGLLTFGLLILIYVVTGSIYPTFEIPGYTDPLEATGLFLLFSILPAYLLACMATNVAATPQIIQAVKKVIPEQHHGLLNRLDRVKYWQIGVIAALINAVVANIPWQLLSFDPAQPHFIFSITLVFSQAITWGVIGLVLAIGLHNAFIFHRVGKLVKVDIYHLDSLNVFGQSGLRNVLIVVGALALTPLQALDQEFRWENYQNPVLVGVPAILLLLLVPIWAVHKEIKNAKKAEVLQLNNAIAETPRSLETTSLARLNALVECRNLVLHSRNWPMDLSIFSRVIFYVLIPPLAWTGAALVELAIDAFLTG